mmetsp:Transcript_60915/g.145172  ORF Transcript_60915/g.145172 Transcript_60915/m.145172 type:complete len:378 (+) Transcript_60915:51-1184(+)
MRGRAGQLPISWASRAPWIIALWQALCSVTDALVLEVHKASLPACSCDCCLAQPGRSTTAQSIPGFAVQNAGLVCVSRASAVAATDVSDGSCADNCLSAPSREKRYHAEAEYAEWCFSNCFPVGDASDVLCADRSTAEDVAKRRSMVLLAHKANSSAGDGASTENDAMSISIAKTEMLNALAHAREAGKAAREAKAAFDAVMSAPKDAARMVGMQKLQQLKQEAGEQAWRARDKHERFVENAQQAAVQAATDAMNEYKQAQVRDLQVADSWNKRSVQYAEAASKRQQLSQQEADQAERFRQQGEFELAKEKVVQAHQTINQAAAFRATAEQAHKQAVAIGSATAWYAYAEQAAAAHAMAESLPPNVPAPPLPPLPAA